MSDCAGAAAGLGSAFATILRSMVMGGTRVIKVSILGVLSGWDGIGIQTRWIWLEIMLSLNLDSFSRG